MTILNRPNFEYILCERKNSASFIKVITYINDADGYVEVARINPTKTCWAEEGSNDIETIFNELQYNAKSVLKTWDKEG